MNALILEDTTLHIYIITILSYGHRSMSDIYVVRSKHCDATNTCEAACASSKPAALSLTPSQRANRTRAAIKPSSTALLIWGQSTWS